MAEPCKQNTVSLVLHLPFLKPMQKISVITYLFEGAKVLML